MQSRRDELRCSGGKWGWRRWAAAGVVIGAVLSGAWTAARQSSARGDARKVGVRLPLASPAMFGRQFLSGRNASAAEAARPAGVPAATEHPLDPALEIARDGLRHIDENVRDYTATLIKRERVGGRLQEYQSLEVKVRHRRLEEGGVITPFSVYLKFIAPRSLAGREVIWVEGQGDGRLIAHESGFKNLLRVRLEPTSFLAMLGNRYPISKIGMRNLVEELIIKGEAERQRGEIEVEFFDNAKVDGRLCRMIQITHPVKRPYFDFYRAQIFIDQELTMPIRYAAWTWPLKGSSEPVLEEEYTYRDVRLNVDLTDRDFDPDNPAYNFP